MQIFWLMFLTFEDPLSLQNRISLQQEQKHKTLRWQQVKITAKSITAA